MTVALAPEDEDWRWTVSSTQTVGSRTGRVRHAEGRVRVLDMGGAPRVDLASIRQRCVVHSAAGEGDALRSIQDEHLRFGPRWQVLRSLAIGEREALARLELASPFAGDIAAGFDLHPALLDIATGYAMELIPGYEASAGLWAPLSYGRLRIAAPLPASIWSWVRLKGAGQNESGIAAFDVTIVDDQGRILADVERFTVRRLGPAATLAVTYAERDLETAADAGRRRGETSPALARLAAQVSQGIAPEEGTEALLRALSLGRPQVVVSSLDLDALIKRAVPMAAAEEAHSADMFQRPDLDTEYVAPSTDIERTLADFWAELLGVKTIGVNDSFFDLGGHSLIAVRLFRMIKKAFSVEFPISVLFEAPTIAQCAALIEQAGGGTGAAAEPTAPIGDGGDATGRGCGMWCRCIQARIPTRPRCSSAPECSATSSTCAISRSAWARTAQSTVCRRVASMAATCRTRPSRKWRATTSRRCARCSRTGPTSWRASRAAASWPTRWRGSCRRSARRCRRSSCSTRPCRVNLSSPCGTACRSACRTFSVKG